MVRGERALWLAQVLLWLTALGTATYWLAYLGGFRFSEGVECSRQLQVAQIPSNTWIVVCCCLGAVGLRREQRWGLLMTVAAASAGLYIGLLDITFNVQAGTYLRLPWVSSCRSCLPTPSQRCFPRTSSPSSCGPHRGSRRQSCPAIV